jgi:hypothetical protein
VARFSGLCSKTPPPAYVIKRAPQPTPPPHPKHPLHRYPPPFATACPKLSSGGSVRVCVPKPRPSCTLSNGRPNRHHNVVSSTPLTPSMATHSRLQQHTRNRAPVARFSCLWLKPHPARTLLNGCPNRHHRLNLHTPPILSITPTTYFHPRSRNRATAAWFRVIGPGANTYIMAQAPQPPPPPPHPPHLMHPLHHSHHLFPTAHPEPSHRHFGFPLWYLKRNFISFSFLPYNAS